MSLMARICQKLWGIRDLLYFDQVIGLQILFIPIII